MHRMLRASLAALVAAAFVTVSVTGTSAQDKAKGVAIGQTAPGFSLQDQTGKTHNLADYSGKLVVLEWFNNQCPYVVKHYQGGHMNATADKYEDKGVIWLAINTTRGTDNAYNAKIAAEWKIDRPILNDAGDGAVGKAYGARTTPHMYVVNKDGTLAYMGAIDSNSSSKTEDISGSTNYVAKALDELLAGQPVSTPETKAYGCSVKYAK